MKERLSLFIFEANRRHGIIYFFMGLLIFLSASSGTFAQTAQISGRITDSSQAAVVGSSITLTNVDTGEHRHSASIDSGYYSFPSLLPGHYSIKVSKDGFDELERGGITVETGKTSTIDVTLRVGHVAQSVVVNADAPLLQTDSAAVAGVVENKTIVNMPLVDRRTAQLQRLNGFVVQNGTGSSVLGGSGGASFALAGGRGNNAYYMIDGNNAQNVLLGVPVLAFDPPVESVQEFNVAISNYSAELGRSGGGIIQITTKSGTNSFHGSAYEYLRNDALDARTYFAKSKPKRRFNLFGATFGGPFQKDKTWFFGNYEGRRQNTASANVLNVPTALEATGDFSDQSTIILDPNTGQPFALNKIPHSRLDKVGLALASFYPTPNVAGALPGKANFVANDPVISTVDDYVVRVDHSFSDKDRAFFRSLGELGKATTATIFPTPGTDQYGYINKSYYVNSAASWTHTFSPLALNVVRVGFVINQNEWLSAGAGSGINGQIGLGGVNPAFFPQVTINGYEPLGNATQKRIQGPVKSTEVVDAFTLIRGRHQLQFGGAFHNAINPDNEYLPTAGGAFTFNAIGTGNSIASLLLGRVYQASILQTEDLDTRAATLGLFVQDDWRVTPKLTLNVGLRYDIDQPRYEIHNRQNGFDANAINPVSGTPGVVTFSGRNGLSKYANHWDLHNYGPRLGFAWNVTPGWVVRGGGGILYTPEYYGATPIVASAGFSKQGTFVSPDNGVTPAFQLADGMPTVEFPSSSDLTPGYGAVPVGTTPNTSITYFKRNRTTGYLYQSSLDVQHEISNNLVIDIGYLGTFGHHLSSMTPQSINQVPTDKLGPGNAQARRPFPQFSNVQILEPDIGASNYHGVNIGLQKRYSRGLQLQADYTFAKFIDNVDSMSELAEYPANVFTNYYDRRSDRGLSGNDVRNRLIVSTVYDLPFGHGRLIEPSNRVIGTALGGWTIGAIAEFRSGTPLSPFELTNNTGSFSDGVRPNIIGATSLAGDRSKAAKVAQWFNTAAFAAPAAYTFGNAGRTFGTGPGATNLDASLLKDFRVGDRTVVQFRTEALNVINRANFANPNTLQGSPTFGQITSLASGNQARIIQLGLHLAF